MTSGSSSSGVVAAAAVVVSSEMFGTYTGCPWPLLRPVLKCVEDDRLSIRFLFVLGRVTKFAPTLQQFLSVVK